MPPFIEGNGTTYCAACYFLLCVRSGDLLPGLKIVPERIKEDRDGYERALFAADRAWDHGHLDFSVMEDYLATLLQAQLADDGLVSQRMSSFSHHSRSAAERRHDLQPPGPLPSVSRGPPSLAARQPQVPA